VKRGDVRAAALSLLAEEPRNGYQIIQAISERSEGVWQPSPGSVYPALQQLEDEGLIRAEEAEGGRRAFRLTDEGQEYVAEHADELRAPWEAVAGSVGDDMIDMRQLFGQVAMAGMQVISVGNREQIDAARRVLTQARRRLYQILAADDETTDADADADTDAGTADARDAGSAPGDTAGDAGDQHDGGGR
jgi:DNA-binding PadR family transcriptional regulator